jgi:hypothetical protein
MHLQAVLFSAKKPDEPIIPMQLKHTPPEKEAPGLERSQSHVKFTGFHIYPLSQEQAVTRTTEPPLGISVQEKQLSPFPLIKPNE